MEKWTEVHFVGVLFMQTYKFGDHTLREYFPENLLKKRTNLYAPTLYTFCAACSLLIKLGPKVELSEWLR